MPRLADPDPNTVPDDVREFLAQLPPDPMVKMLTHSVSTVKLFIQTAQAQFTSLALPARSRELVTLTVAKCAECAFVASQHESMSEAAGVDRRTRELIASGAFDSPELSAYDSTLIRFAAEVMARPRVSDERFAQVRELLTEREIAEVLQVIGFYWSFCRVCTVLDVDFAQPAGMTGASTSWTSATRPRATGTS